MYVIWLFVLIIILISTYILLYFKFDINHEEITLKKAQLLSQNDSLSTLLNASSINNIPNLNINTHNDKLQLANNCGKSPISVSQHFDDADCVKVCLSSSAHAMVVDDSNIVYADNKKLINGTYCTIGKKPNCNPRTTTTMLTINSVICRSKYPNLVGGPTGNHIIACNNSEITDPLNVLWDYKFNELVKTSDVILFDEDEKLNDGNYRFRCKFNGVDDMYNKYVQHPTERFHPIKNYCSHLIYSAHPSIKPIFDENKYECDCGNYSLTRVRNLDPNEKTTPCSDKQIKTVIDGLKHTSTIPYRCFNINSPITDVTKYLPCSGDRFTRHGSLMQSIDFTYSTNEHTPIELPFYDQLPEKHDNILQRTNSFFS